MIREFIRHQWLQFRRSPSFGREMGMTALVIFVGAMITFSLLILAITLPKLITSIPTQKDPVSLLNEMVIYYFLLDAVMRYLIQKVPALDVQPYLCLPVKRKTIAGYLLGRSLFSLFNIYPVMLLLPVTLQFLAPRYGTMNAVIWLASISLFSLCIHFLNILFKKKYDSTPWVWIILVVIASSNYALNYFYGYSFLEPLGAAMESILVSPYLIFIPVLGFLLLLYATYKFLGNHLYLEELVQKSDDHLESYSASFGFLNRGTLSNVLILQEIRLILRHKRTRSVLLLSLIFVGYGLLFFGNEAYQDSKGFFVFIGVFMSALFTINYGQFFWGWNTNQLDFYFTRPISLRTWISSRYRLLVISSILSTVLCIPYVYFGWDILLLMICGCLFNIGVNIPVMIRLSMWSPKAIDLNRSSFMNYQGTGVAQWLMAIPMLVGPYLIFLPVNYFGGFVPGILALGIVGLIGCLFRNQVITRLTNRLRVLKYKFIRDLTL
ncbi:DUF5687 family protein [Fulvivirga sedimenti]|uniref:DUF5687 family protein n=1 Tax=Fulvivirga sedimenti TaxID=2879465 RepID=A0A9X1KZX6_9BACT|nr:DUF5687 family protein [Fulvivirga sedimenti]MCA6078800.1 DUF5687 family protein [Fulvivirga sedimenti]